MDLAEARRHQELYRLADQLLATVSEQFLHLGIDAHNLTPLVSYYDRIWGKFKELLECRFVLRVRDSSSLILGLRTIQESVLLVCTT